MSRVRTEFFPQDILTVYDSPSGMKDVRTGNPYNCGGLNVGDYVELTDDEAKRLSNSQCHSGIYRFVKIDSGATAANIKRGTIGLMTSLAKGVNVITSFDKGFASGVRPVVFLATVTAAQVTAGAYVVVQEAGDASVLTKTGASGSAGDVLLAASGDAGAVTVASGSANPTYTTYTSIIGNALEAPSSAALCRCLLHFPPVQG